LSANEQASRTRTGSRLPTIAGLVWLALTCGAVAQQPSADAGSRSPSTLRVGPTRTIQTIAEAARRARDGDTVEVDAGDYRRDVAVWRQDRLTIRAVGGRVRLLADGDSAEGKAIWVVRGGRVSVEGFDFEGTRVAARNGAGIRFEAGQLTVHDCRFFDNEMGLLTSNDPHAELTIEDSEFAHNMRPDGHDHNLYAGTIAKLSVRGSYIHHATIGHLLKSRAAVNHIFYNRLTDEAGGRASYELEFPNGGVAVVVGNIIEQSALTENTIMISYGAEGYQWPTNALVLVNNTLVDDLPHGGVFLRVVPGNVQVKAVNNLLVGNDSLLDTAAPGDYHDNFHVDQDAFVDAPGYDYRLVRGASVLGKAVDPGQFDGMALRPTHEYAHPRGTATLTRPARHPGALQHLADR
jgi:hypothetical protein